MIQRQPSTRLNSHAETRPGVVISTRTWLPTAEQLAELEANWTHHGAAAPRESQNGASPRQTELAV